MGLHDVVAKSQDEVPSLYTLNWTVVVPIKTKEDNIIMSGVVKKRT